MFWVVVAKKIRPGTFGERLQPIRIQIESKDGIGYPMQNQLDGKIGIRSTMHRVNNAKAEIGYYCIVSVYNWHWLSFKKINCRFDCKNGIGYPIPNWLDGKIEIGYPMHRVNDAKVNIGYYCIVSLYNRHWLSFKKWMAECPKVKKNS
jgi:hypothetical protein